MYSKGFSSRESVALKIPDVSEALMLVYPAFVVSPLFSCNIYGQFLCLLKGLDEISREKQGEGDGSISMSDRSGTSTDTKVIAVCSCVVQLCCDCFLGDQCVISAFGDVRDGNC